MSTAVSLPITKYPITTRLTTDHRPRYRYRRDSRRCKPRGSTCKPRGTPAGSTSAVSPTRRTNQSSENSWATRWRRCVHLNFFLVIFGYFWLFLVIFAWSIRLNHSCFVTYRLAERRRRTTRVITSRASSPCTSTARNNLRLWSFEPWRKRPTRWYVYFNARVCRQLD